MDMKLIEVTVNGMIHRMIKHKTLSIKLSQVKAPMIMTTYKYICINKITLNTFMWFFSYSSWHFVFILGMPIGIQE